LAIVAGFVGKDRAREQKVGGERHGFGRSEFHAGPDGLLQTRGAILEGRLERVHERLQDDFVGKPRGGKRIRGSIGWSELDYNLGICREALSSVKRDKALTIDGAGDLS
jgi:hypothetical protein